MELVGIFRDLGFPAGIALILLLFAWHVSKELLRSHRSFIDGVHNSLNTHISQVTSINEELAKQRNLLANHHEILERQTATIEKLADIQAEILQCIRLMPEARRRTGSEQ